SCFASLPRPPGHHPSLACLYRHRISFISYRIPHNGAPGYTPHSGFAFGSMHFLAYSRLTCPSLKLVAIAVIYQGIQISCSFQVYTTPPTSITPVWTSQRRELFPPEMTRTVSTITRLDKNFCMIVEHNMTLI